MSEDNLIPAGRCLARVTEAVMARTNSGSPQIAVGFELIEPESLSGRQITWYGSLSQTVISGGKYQGQTVAQKTFDTMEVLGWDFDEKSFASCVGSEASLVIEHEEDNSGIMRAKVQWVNPPTPVGAAVKERLSGGEQAMALSAFKAELLKRKQKAGAKRAAGNGAAYAGGAPADDDIPFNRVDHRTH